MMNLESDLSDVQVNHLDISDRLQTHTGDTTGETEIIAHGMHIYLVTMLHNGDT